MGMPVFVEIISEPATQDIYEKVFNYFTHIDERFSTYKETSEISAINRGERAPEEYSAEMKEVLALSEETRRLTDGYFDIRVPGGLLDPSGLVKGWAINNAAQLLKKLGYADFYVEAGGDIETSGRNGKGEEWSIGIRNPFDRDKIVKVIYPRGHGVATSGTYARGAHIYNPHEKRAVESDLVSLTVIGGNVYEADRFATAAFAMGKKGMAFIEKSPELEGYAIDKQGIAVMTGGFEAYTKI